MVKAQKRTGKPLVMYAMDGRADRQCFHILRKEGIPVFDSMKIAARALRGLREYDQIKTRKIREVNVTQRVSETPNILKEAAKRVNRNLTEPEAYSLLQSYSMPVAPYQLASSKNEAVQAVDKIGFPLVMKLCSPDIIHKSDFGGVQVGISSVEGVGKAYHDIIKKATSLAPWAQIEGTILAKQQTGIEVIAGVFRDQQFGPVLMVGLGGIFVEIIKDVVFRILPVGTDEIYEMLEELKAYPLLKGARGKKPVNLESLVELLNNLGQMVIENPEIAEVDLNPIFVNTDSAVVADARIIVS